MPLRERPDSSFPKKGIHLKYLLTLSQMTNSTLFHIERVCKRQCKL